MPAVAASESAAPGAELLKQLKPKISLPDQPKPTKAGLNLPSPRFGEGRVVDPVPAGRIELPEEEPEPEEEVEE